MISDPQWFNSMETLIKLNLSIIISLFVILIILLDEVEIIKDL